MLPSVPGLGQRINGVKLWVDIGPLQFQPGELAKIFLVVSSRPTSATSARRSRSSAEGRRPATRDLGRGDARIVQTSDLGSLLNFGIFLAMLYAATGARRSSAPGSSSSRAVPAPPTGSTASQHDGLARPWTDDKVYCALNGAMEYRQNCDSYQLVKSLYSIPNGGYGGPASATGRSTRSTGRG